jgi:hypothetical protein
LQHWRRREEADRVLVKPMTLARESTGPEVVEDDDGVFTDERQALIEIRRACP